jgi:anti-sigma B factor antagonist
MTIQSEKTGKSSIVLFVSGRLDTNSAPLLERKIKQWGDDITEITLDFSNLTYISSMGLRVLLQAQKSMNEHNRKLTIKNMNQYIREVFEMSGFINLMVQDEKFVVIKKANYNVITLTLIGILDNANVHDLSAELASLAEIWQEREETVTIIMDMEKLEAISSSSVNTLKTAIEETDWPKRNLVFQNANDDVRKALSNEGMGDFFAAPVPQKQENQS